MQTENQNEIMLELCAYKTEELCTFVRAHLKNGKLTIEGQDLGDRLIPWIGDDEYEYFYCFDKANTEKLLKLLTINGKDPLDELKQRFNGPSACRNLRDFCEINGIQFRFDCYY